MSKMSKKDGRKKGKSVRDKYTELIDQLPQDLGDHNKNWIRDHWLEEFIYFDTKAVEAKGHATRLSLIWRYGSKISVVLATVNVAWESDIWYRVAVVLLMLATMYSAETREQYQPQAKWKIHREAAEGLMDEWRDFSVLQGEYKKFKSWDDAFESFQPRVTLILRTNREAGFKIERKAAKTSDVDSRN